MHTIPAIYWDHSIRNSCNVPNWMSLMYKTCDCCMVLHNLICTVHASAAKETYSFLICAVLLLWNRQVHIFENGICGQQLPWWIILYKATGIKDGNFIKTNNGVKLVRDGDNGPVLKRCGQKLVYNSAWFRVKAGVKWLARLYNI